MAGASGGEAWRISGEDRMKHDSQFFQLKPINGFITGEQAKGFFMQSGLPTAVLGQIWTLSDMNNDGKMDKKEFSIAMHLIKKKLQGFELPKALPASLKADPSPMTGGFSMAPPMGMSMVTGMPMMSGLAPTNMTSSSMAMPIMSNGAAMGMMGQQPMGMPGMMADTKPRTGSFGPAQVPVQSGPPAGGFSMPHNSKLRHTQTFNTNDRNKRGHLTGVEARALLVQTGLPQPILAQIWNLADYDKDGKLTCDEFCIAMHLADLVRTGVTLPAKLPPELFPAKVRAGSITGPAPRTGSFTGTPPPHQPGPQKPPDAFGDLLGSMGMQQAPPIQPNQPAENVIEEQQPVTFEDKRKENFDKGQAELERRRQQLQEQMRAENNARLEKERQEQEKRERIRQEQERKRLMELERQMEKQRQIEREKEQQRQKMLEQKEAARRESERQRQMEWERQRKEQLLAEKAREYQQLSNAKSKSNNLKCELESLQGKKTEIGQKISQVRKGVTDFTSSIESMRITRDNKNAEIERLQNEIKTLDQKFAKLKQDQEFLNVKVQTTIQSNPMAETYRTVLHSVELKKTTIQKLKKELEQIERETESRLQEIDNTNTELKNLKSKLDDIQRELGKADKQKVDMKARITADYIVKKEREEQEKKRKEEAARIANLAKAASQPPKPVPPAGSSLNNDNAWFDFNKAGNQPAAKSDDIWSAAFSEVNASSAGSQDIWSNAFSSQQKDTSQDTSRTRAQALYQFEARNHDELSLNPGDIVLLLADQSGAEPGWLGGEKDGKTGWFPEAYVEKLDSSQSNTDAFGSANVTSEEYSTPAAVSELRITSPTPGQGEKAPDGLQAQALYPWKAKKDNHLTFNKGDVIVIKEQQDMWWSGELNGQVGWFPKSYVKLIGGVATNTSQTNSRSETPITGDQSRGTPVQVTSTAVDPLPQIAAINQLQTDSSRSTPTQLNQDSARSTPATLEQKEGETYVAVYSYQSSEPGDLNFSQNEVVMVTKKDGDWWTGCVGERTGIFPHNYVKKMDIPQGTLPTVESLLSKTVSSIELSDEGIDFTHPQPNTGLNLTFDPITSTVSSCVTSPGDSAFVDDPFSTPDFNLDPFPSEQDLPTSDSFGGFGASSGTTSNIDESSGGFGKSENVPGDDSSAQHSMTRKSIEVPGTFSKEDDLFGFDQDSSAGSTQITNIGFDHDPFASTDTANTSSDMGQDLFAGMTSSESNDLIGSNQNMTFASTGTVTPSGEQVTCQSEGSLVEFADVFGDSTKPETAKAKPAEATKEKPKKSFLGGLFKKKQKQRKPNSNSESVSIGSPDVIESPDSPKLLAPLSPTGSSQGSVASPSLDNSILSFPTSFDGGFSDGPAFDTNVQPDSSTTISAENFASFDQGPVSTGSNTSEQKGDNLNVSINENMNSLGDLNFAFGASDNSSVTVDNSNKADFFDQGLYEEVQPKTPPKAAQPVEPVQEGEMYEDISDLIAARKEEDKLKANADSAVSTSEPPRPERKVPPRPPPPRPAPPKPQSPEKKKVRFKLEEPGINVEEIEQSAIEEEEEEKDTPPLPPQRRRRKNSQEVEQKLELTPLDNEQEAEGAPPVVPMRKKRANSGNVDEKVAMKGEETLSDKDTSFDESSTKTEEKSRKDKKAEEKLRKAEEKARKAEEKARKAEEKKKKKEEEKSETKGKSKLQEKAKSMENLSEDGKGKGGKKLWPWKKKADQDMSKSMESLDTVGSGSSSKSVDSLNTLDSSGGSVFYEEPVSTNTQSSMDSGDFYEPVGVKPEIVQASANVYLDLPADDQVGVVGNIEPGSSDVHKAGQSGVSAAENTGDFCGGDDRESPMMIIGGDFNPDWGQDGQGSLSTNQMSVGFDGHDFTKTVTPTNTLDYENPGNGSLSQQISSSQTNVGYASQGIDFVDFEEPDGTQTYEDYLGIADEDYSAVPAVDVGLGPVDSAHSNPVLSEPDGSQTYDDFMGISTSQTCEPGPSQNPLSDHVTIDPGAYFGLHDNAQSLNSASNGLEQFDYEYAVHNSAQISATENNTVTCMSSELADFEDYTAEETYEEVGSPLRKKMEESTSAMSENVEIDECDQMDLVGDDGIFTDYNADEKTPEPAQPSPPTTQTTTSQPPAQQKGGTIKKPEIASVIAAYSATGPEQLSLQPGQVIQVRKKSPSGWWEGELQARGQKKKIGWFPANYVKLLGGTRSTPDNTLQGQKPGQDQRLTPTPAATTASSNPSPQPQQNYVEQVLAVYPYAAQHDDELTFQKDAIINVLNKDDPNWWKGEVNGSVGMFPSNYVGPLTMSPPQDNTWSSDPVVLATTSAQESKRQNYIHELINTEETYMEDMSIVMEAFLEPMRTSGVLTEEEIEMVFVNWNELILCNTKLSRSLRVRKKMIGKGQVIQVIGDILCENIPHLTPYIRFCSCQLRAAALIQHKTENSPEFKEVHKRCVTNPKTKCMPLSSFLLKPMQRITKYPLMIQKIIQYTPEGHPDNQNLREALTKAEELCSQVNEGVRERENSDKLEWMQGHINCDGLPEKLTFNSVTNCLGPRKILFSGTLFKMKSNKELVGFLCNDFLLLTIPISSNSTKFVFDQKAKSQFKIYKTPIFLNEIMVKRVGDEDSDTMLFQVCHIDRVYNFKAANNTERENWVKHLSLASKSYIETERKRREKVHSFEEPNNKVGRMLVIISEGINLAPSQNVKRTAGVGRLLVVIQEGCDLQPRDANGKSDPYCEVSMGAQEHKTKVIPATLNPKWNQNMQFYIRDLDQDVLCITVFDRDLFSPNDFLGRTEIRVKEILSESKEKRGPITKRLLLHEISSGEVVVKLDLQLYEGIYQS